MHVCQLGPYQELKMIFNILSATLLFLIFQNLGGKDGCYVSGDFREMKNIEFSTKQFKLAQLN